MHEHHVFTDVSQLQEPVDGLADQIVAPRSSRVGIGHLRLFQPQGELHEHRNVRPRSPTVFWG